MGSALSVLLSGQLESFRNIMDQNGRESQMEDIDQIITYVKSIQMDLEDTMDEVGYLLEQLQSMKVSFSRIQEDMQEGFLHVENQIKEVKKEVMGGIQNAMNTLKEKGIQALDQLLDTTHVYQSRGL